MSRVTKPKNKWVNSVKYSPEVYEPSKVTIINKGKIDNDYTKANSLAKWLLLKYGFSYKQYRRKSKVRRNQLKEEYFSDCKNL